MSQQIRQRDETEKVNLLQSCTAYKHWSKQPLVKVANILEWTSFPANTGSKISIEYLKLLSVRNFLCSFSVGGLPVSFRGDREIGRVPRSSPS